MSRVVFFTFIFPGFFFTGDDEIFHVLQIIQWFFSNLATLRILTDLNLLNLKNTEIIQYKGRESP